MSVRYLGGKAELTLDIPLAGYTRSELETKFGVFDWRTGAPGMDEIALEKNMKEEDPWAL